MIEPKPTTPVTPQELPRELGLDELVHVSGGALVTGNVDFVPPAKTDGLITGNVD
ncbi:hypothetical protein OOZ63_09445 [Paucibacter sp. PLA-PC-4]|uniref:hypothetical protein n=1 Tax=Paucibacter sp. PLA-PC-4 TaxID=2993655 RepID=UPI002248A077|nr:hypothetical protein [Paucibacter sp. PLA-PC-4]MCX2862064.1 hypothetical protein [Paucibacter sp. PLA-PC-4]